MFKTMPCLTRTPSRGPFVLARTVVLVSALALLGYLPLANPLTSPSRRERPPGNFAKQNCRIVLAFSVENVSPSGWRLRRHTSPSPSLGVRASGLNCFCRNLKHFSPKGCRSSEERFARRRNGNASNCGKTTPDHRMAGRGTTIIHSDAKHQEWKLRFLGGARGGYEPRFKKR